MPTILSGKCQVPGCTNSARPQLRNYTVRNGTFPARLCTTHTTAVEANPLRYGGQIDPLAPTIVLIRPYGVDSTGSYWEAPR